VISPPFPPPFLAFPLPSLLPSILHPLLYRYRHHPPLLALAQNTLLSYALNYMSGEEGRLFRARGEEDGDGIEREEGEERRIAAEEGGARREGVGKEGSYY